MHLSRLLLAAIAVAPASLPAQATPPDTTSKPGGSTTTLPLPYTRSAKFTTDEGTWMSLDVSPDGLIIVFDLAGDLYTLPIGGGKATRITDGPGYDCQPRFAPDGKTIIFQSDRSGSENIYSVTTDGKTVKALTTGEGQEYLSPVWAPDGNYFYVSQTGYNTLGPYTLYMYSKDGGPGIKISTASSPYGPPAPNAVGIAGSNVLGAAFGSDPRYIYYEVGGRWGYNIQQFAWSVQRYDFVTGETKIVARRPNAAIRPMLSRDGKWLVYATRRDTSTAFRVRNLETAEESWLIDNVQRDDMESRFTRDILPGSAFTPDSKAIVTSFNGKFWKVEVPSGRLTQIPFTADVDVQLGDRVRFDYPIDDTAFVATQIRDTRLSPDNKRIVFTALDRIYLADLPNGTPRRLTKTDIGEFHPVWSPDGQWVAYVTWNDSTGEVYRVRADGSGEPERVSKVSAAYSMINYSPSGSRILANTSARGGYDATPDTKLVWFPATGGNPTLISDSKQGFPYFLNGDSTRIYIGIESFLWNGTDSKTDVKMNAWGATFNRDGSRIVAAGSNNKLTLARVPFARALPLETLTQGNPILYRNISTIVAPEFVAWSDDGSRVIWSSGRHLFIYDVAKGDSLTADSVAKAKATAPPDTTKRDSTATPKGPAYLADRIEVIIHGVKDRPTGVIALRNARIITAKGDEVFETGDMVITNNRISAIGQSGTVTIPAGATVMDLRGKTIMPGLVDVHSHPWPKDDIHSRQPWVYAAALAFGITTSRDPQSGGTDIFSYQDLVESGDILGPRIYTTGPGLFGPGYGGGENLNTLDKARDALRQYSDYYYTKTLKQYLTGERKARQYILMAAKELKISPTLEGGLDFKKNITEAIDGYAGSEHAYPITPLYKDMVEIIAKSGITYTPTLLVSYGGPWTENLMYEKYQYMYSDPKLRRFVPQSALDERFLRRPQWFNEKLYVHKRLAAQAAKIVNAGGHVGLGGHGQFTGLGDQWELWLIASGGMRPIDAIKCGTIFGAEEIGLSNDLGSLEVGKLADLLVLERNPLEDITNTASIKYVMKNGRLYEGETLDEVYPRHKPMRRGRWMWDDDDQGTPHPDVMDGDRGQRQ